jgi:hypothetical protein
MYSWTSLQEKREDKVRLVGASFMRKAFCGPETGHYEEIRGSSLFTTELHLRITFAQVITLFSPKFSTVRSRSHYKGGHFMIR